MAALAIELADESWIVVVFSTICIVFCPLLCWISAIQLQKASAKISLSLIQYSDALTSRVDQAENLAEKNENTVTKTKYRF